MAKKGKKKGSSAPPRSSAGKKQSVQWIMVAAILFFFAAGFLVKLVFAPVSGAGGVGSANYQVSSSVNNGLESRVKLVAANFRCACGRCGELFLVDCTCDMPRGAKEEKEFIRKRLRQGLTVEQVTDLVDKEYGHRIG